MSRGWTLLKNKAEFRSYQEALLREHNLTGRRVHWGTEPAAYPCLVASKLLGTTQVLACYCLPADAKELLAAVAVDCDPGQDALDMAALPAALTQRQVYDRQMAAHIMAVISFMVRTGLCKEVAYEREYNYFLTILDQDATGRKDLSVKSAFETIARRATMDAEAPTDDHSE